MKRLRWEKYLLTGITAVFIVLGIRLLTHQEKEPSISEEDLSDTGEAISENGNSGDEKGSAGPVGQDQSSTEPENKKILVHVDGRVNKPGLYEFNEGDRVEQAIEAAGGLKDKADLSGINLAMKLQDEMKIFVPKEGDGPAALPTPNQVGGPESGKIKGKVNINKAGLDELTSLPSIGPARAQDIIDYRQAGPFKSLEELKKIPGIGDKTFEKLKDKVCL